MPHDQAPGHEDTFFVAQYGLSVARRDLFPFLAVFDLLDRYLDRLAVLNAAAGAAPDEPDVDAVRRVAQERMTRFQKENAVLSESILNTFLSGLRMTVDDLQGALIEQALVAAGRRQMIDREDEVVPHLVREMVIDGVANQALLRIAVTREAAEAASAAGIEVDAAMLEECESWLALVHWVGSRRALREKIESTGIAAERLRDAVRSLALARALHARRGQPFETPAAFALDSLLQARLKAEGSKTRVAPARETVEKVLRHKERIGITRIAEMTQLDVLGIPIFAVVRPNAKVAISGSSGKGLTRDDAMASGLMESTEIFVAENPRETGCPIRTAAFAEPPPGEELVDPQTLVLSRFTPEPYDPRRPIEWIRGVDLVDGRPKWVPLEVVAMGDVDLILNEVQQSNGLASGNNAEEAISHALGELIERDAYKTAFYALCEAHIHPSDLGFARIAKHDLPARSKQVVETIESKGLEVRLYDVTSDIEVPTVWAVLVEEKVIPEGPCGHPADELELYSGWGTDVDPEVALLRAITEAAQTHTGNIQGSREDMEVLARSGSHRVGAGKETAVDVPYTSIPAYFRRFAEFMFSPAVATRSLSQMAGAEHRDIREDIRFMLQRLVRRGLRQAIYFDLSMPDLGVSVARMVVPGLEHIDLDRTGWRCHRFILHPASVFARRG